MIIIIIIIDKVTGRERRNTNGRITASIKRLKTPKVCGRVSDMCARLRSWYHKMIFLLFFSLNFGLLWFKSINYHLVTDKLFNNIDQNEERRKRRKKGTHIATEILERMVSKRRPNDTFFMVYLFVVTLFFFFFHFSSFGAKQAHGLSSACFTC